MFNNKYSNLLTVLLVIAIIGILGLFVFLGIDIYNKYYIQKADSQGVSQFDNLIPDRNANEIYNDVILEPTNVTNTNTTNEIVDPFANLEDQRTNNSSEGNSTSNKVYWNGFVQVGTINIPRTGLNSPVLEKATKKAIEIAVAVQVGPGLNQVGNTIIAGHNYRNGTLFSNNKNIQVGDKIFIKDTSGLTVTYIVYNKFETTPEDASYINKDTQGKREITLYSCNDDSSRRIIIEAREQ